MDMACDSSDGYACQVELQKLVVKKCGMPASARATSGAWIMQGHDGIPSRGTAAAARATSLSHLIHDATITTFRSLTPNLSHLLRCANPPHLTRHGHRNIDHHQRSIILQIPAALQLPALLHAAARRGDAHLAAC